MSRQSAALSSATQHARRPELCGKWGTECLTLGSLCLPCCVRGIQREAKIKNKFIYLLINVLKYIFVIQWEKYNNHKKNYEFQCICFRDNNNTNYFFLYITHNLFFYINALYMMQTI